MAMCNTFDDYLNSIVENKELMAKMETEANSKFCKVPIRICVRFPTKVTLLT